MFRTVTRLIARRHGGFDHGTFVFEGLTSGKAGVAADMLKFNIERERGLHQQSAAFKNRDFESLGDHKSVSVNVVEATV